MATEEQKAYWREYYERNRKVIAERKRKYRAGGKRSTNGVPRWDPAQSEAASQDPAMSYEEIAAELGLTKARVGQIMESALRKLRAAYPGLRGLLR